MGLSGTTRQRGRRLRELLQEIRIEDRRGRSFGLRGA
jgi:hypothetical protein